MKFTLLQLTKYNDTNPHSLLIETSRFERCPRLFYANNPMTITTSVPRLGLGLVYLSGSLCGSLSVCLSLCSTPCVCVSVFLCVLSVCHLTASPIKRGRPARLARTPVLSGLQFKQTKCGGKFGCELCE